jgi:hypothetical protein
VSPGPAASSSTTCPGWGSIASTIACETGSAAAWNASPRTRQPAAARSQRSRASTRWVSASTARKLARKTRQVPESPAGYFVTTRKRTVVVPKFPATSRARTVSS